MTADQMEEEKLALERSRLALDARAKRLEGKLAGEKQRLAEREFEVNLGPRGWVKDLFTPSSAVISAIVAAIIGLVGTFRAKQTELEIESKRDLSNAELERVKQETSIILKASEVQPQLDESAKELVRAQNILWFFDAGYIKSLPEERVKKLRAIAATSGRDTGAPPAVQTTNQPSAPPIQTYGPTASVLVRDGDDLVVNDASTNWWGASPHENGMTAVGVDLDKQPDFEGCALPFLYRGPKGLPKPSMSTLVEITNVATGERIKVPFIDYYKESQGEPGIDLTKAAYKKLYGSLERGMRVNYRIIGGAKYLDAKKSP